MPISYKDVVDYIDVNLHNTMIERVRQGRNVRSDVLSNTKLREYYHHVFTDADRKKYNKSHRYVAKLMEWEPSHWSKQEMIKAWLKDMYHGNWRSKSVPPFLAEMVE